MSPAAATVAGRARQPRLFEGARRDAPDRPAPARRERRPCAEPGRVTLEQRLDDLLAAATSAGSAECPMCQATMTPAAGGASCQGCGTTVH